MIEYFAAALHCLHPGCEFTINGDEYEGLTWLTDGIPKPTKEDVIAAAAICRDKAEKDYLKKQIDEDTKAKLAQSFTVILSIGEREIYPKIEDLTILKLTYDKEVSIDWIFADNSVEQISGGDLSIVVNAIADRRSDIILSGRTAKDEVDNA